MSSPQNKSGWSTASVSAPFIGILVAVPVVFLFGPVFGLVFAYFICFGFAVLGLVFAVVSLLLREKSSGLSVFALFLNGVPLILLLLVRNARIVGP